MRCKKEQKINVDKIKTIVIGILCFFFIISTIVTAYMLHAISGTFMVSGVSMYPTYQDGEIVAIDEDTTHVKRQDVVIIEKASEEKYIKRVIATGGDTIEIKDDKIYVNGTYIEEQRGISKDMHDERAYPVKLKENEYFVMGDNRTDSWDSRSISFGLVDKSEITAIVTGEKEK